MFTDPLTLIPSALKRAWQDMNGTEGLGDALIGDYQNNYPDREPPTAQALQEYWETEFGPGEMAALVEKLATGLRSDQGLIVWRSVQIADEPISAIQDYAQENGLGRFWSFDRNAAHPHEGTQEGPTYLLEARIDADSIDWIETLGAAAVPDWMGEQEVRLLPEATLIIRAIVQRDGWLHRGPNAGEEWVDMRAIENIVFTAGPPTSWDAGIRI
jgi:hypothetical protein